jgi:hypothetical protein
LEQGVTGRKAKRRSTLRRELAWILAIKLMALALLRVLFFSPASQPRVDSAAVGSRLAAGMERQGYSDESYQETRK